MGEWCNLLLSSQRMADTILTTIDGAALRTPSLNSWWWGPHPTSSLPLHYRRSNLTKTNHVVHSYWHPRADPKGSWDPHRGPHPPCLKESKGSRLVSDGGTSRWRGKCDLAQMIMSFEWDPAPPWSTSPRQLTFFFLTALGLELFLTSRINLTVPRRSQCDVTFIYCLPPPHVTAPPANILYFRATLLCTQPIALPLTRFSHPVRFPILQSFLSLLFY